jgi:hypothetical protein
VCTVPSESVTFQLPFGGLPVASTHMPNSSKASFMLCKVLWVAQPPVQSSTSPLGLTRTMSVACSLRTTSPEALSTKTLCAWRLNSKVFLFGPAMMQLAS